MADVSSANAGPTAKALGSKPGLWLEFLLLYGVVPALAIFRVLPIPLIPLLLVVGLYCIVRLRRDLTFDRARLRPLNGVQAGPTLRRLLPAGLVVALGMAAIVWLDDPSALFVLPRQHTLLWAAIMVLYPLLSVWPQEVIYRVYFFHRFDPLFRRPVVTHLTSALVFGLHHWVFHNWIAVALTLIGGWRFAVTYRRTRSLGMVCLEHALFGCLLFTIGLGRYFFSGTARVAEQLLQHAQ